MTRYVLVDTFTGKELAGPFTTYTEAELYRIELGKRLGWEASPTLDRIQTRCTTSAE